MGKANRMLELLMRSIQVSSRARLPRFNPCAVMCAYKAHVRSVLEYGSVIWSGAAVTHLSRLERLQHRFLMWLGAHTDSRIAMDYESLVTHFRCSSIKARFAQADIRFMRSTFNGRLDCNELVPMFALLAPGRRSRHTGLFSVPRGRVNTVQNGFKIRLPKLVNDFLHKTPAEDFFQPTRFFRSNVLRYANSVGTYMS